MVAMRSNVTDVPASDGEISGLRRSSIKRRRTGRAKQTVKATDRDYRRNEKRDKLESMMCYIFRDNEHHDVVVRAIYVC